MRLPPSWMSNTRASMSVSSIADTKSRSVSDATDLASSGTLNTRISRLTVYLHLRCGAGRRVRSQITNASVNICGSMGRAVDSMTNVCSHEGTSMCSCSAAPSPSMRAHSQTPE